MLESDRAQQATQNYINQLAARSQDLKATIASFEEDLLRLKAEARHLDEAALKAKRDADLAYRSSLNAVVTSLEVDPPWEAKLLYDDGVPIAVNVTKQKTSTETD